MSRKYKVLALIAAIFIGAGVYLVVGGAEAIPCKEGIADACQGRMPGISTTPSNKWLQWAFE